jgi:hypothetical protein
VTAHGLSSTGGGQSRIASCGHWAHTWVDAAVT